MNIIYKKIENKTDKYNSYIKALTWDTKRTYSLDDNIGADWLLQRMIGAYDNDKLIALGCISRFYNDEFKILVADLSLIVHKDYRNKGIADNLLRNMIAYCKELNIKQVNANILEKNKISINKAKKYDFNLVDKVDKVLIYEKKLNND